MCLVKSIFHDTILGVKCCSPAFLVVSAVGSFIYVLICDYSAFCIVRPLVLSECM